MLVGLKEVLSVSKKNKIGIGSFNTPTLENLEAVLEASEKLNTPVIIMHAEIHESVAPIDKIGYIMVEMAKRAKTPVCVHLDHGEDKEYIKKAIDIGFSSVMIDKSTCSYDDNVSYTRDVVKMAHKYNVDVEAELGKLPSRENGDKVEVNPNDLYTDPNLVNDYISKTDIDALAIAFGTAHGIYKTPPILNLDIINKVRNVTDIPLVMHGGSGISKEIYKDVIKRGINKINYYTYMSYCGYAKAKEIINKKPTGFYHDIALECKKAMEEHVENVIKVFINKD